MGNKSSRILMKRAVLAIAIAGLLVATFVPTALGTTTRIPFSGTSTAGVVLDPGEHGQAGNKVWARRVVQVYNDAGSPFIEGPDTITYSYNLNLVTGSGALWGTDRLEPVAYPGGAFDCSWHGIFVSFAWTGRVVCRGEGTLGGYQLRGTLVAAPGGDTADFFGFVFAPGD